MEKYRSFKVEDFIIDDFFIRWVLENSEDDAKVWQDWLADNPAEVFKIEQAKNIITSIRFNKVPKVRQAEVDLFIEEVRARHLGAAGKTVSITTWSKKWLGIAAAILVIGICTLFFMRRQPSVGPAFVHEVAFQQTTNKGNSPVFIYMTDGSSVILKPNSTLKYPKTFTAAKREVYLSGEAFFEIYKNSRQPFLVHTGIMTTRVVGTSFTIKAFNGAKDYRVIVNTGKILVYTSEGEDRKAVSNSVMLIPNEEAVYRTAAPGFVKKKLPNPTILSEQVTQKSFDFKGAAFDDVINKLKEAYQVDIVYDQKTFSKCRLTAALYNDHLYDKLTTICKAVDASFTIIKGQIVITGKGCSH